MTAIEKLDIRDWQAADYARYCMERYTLAQLEAMLADGLCGIELEIRRMNFYQWKAGVQAAIDDIKAGETV